MHDVTIIRTSPDSLSQEVWGFEVIDFQIVLDSYKVETRATKKHKFALDNRAMFYNRLNLRDSTVKVGKVPLPEDVAKDALQQVISNFTVVKEYAR